MLCCVQGPDECGVLGEMMRAAFLPCEPLVESSLTLFCGLRVRIGVHTMGAHQEAGQLAFNKTTGRMLYSGEWCVGWGDGCGGVRGAGCCTQVSGVVSGWVWVGEGGRVLYSGERHGGEGGGGAVQRGVICRGRLVVNCCPQMNPGMTK